MKAKNIVVTEADYGRLQRLIESSRQFRKRDVEHIDDLEQEGITIKSPSTRGVAEEAPGAYKDVTAVVVAAEQVIFPAEIVKMSLVPVHPIHLLVWLHRLTSR